MLKLDLGKIIIFLRSSLVFTDMKSALGPKILNFWTRQTFMQGMRSEDIKACLSYLMLFF